MSSGAAKSGKPCERLTAPYFIASRVISRMTDSVNWLALRETRVLLETTVLIVAKNSLMRFEPYALIASLLWQARLTLRALLRKMPV